PPLERGLIRLHHDDVPTLLGADLGDPMAHEPTAQDADLADRHMRALPSSRMTGARRIWGRNRLRCSGFQLRMPRRSTRAGVALAALCAAALVWALPAAGASPAKCNRACQKASKREQLKRLRLQNAQQKRPNVVVIDTDDMNQSDIGVMRNTLALLGAQ